MCALYALTLIAFAGLQFNDPDPVIWIGLYLVCAAGPFLILFNKCIRPVFWIAIVLCCTELLLTGSGAYNYYLHMTEEPLMQSMNPNKPYIEEAREFLGAFIALSFVVSSYLLARYVTQHHNYLR
jgi:hypothetical protein